MKMKAMMLLAAAVFAAAVQAKDAESLFGGAKWIEQPAELNAAAAK